MGAGMKIFVSALCIVWLAAPAYGGHMQKWIQQVPDRVLDWKSTGEDLTFDRETIFKHINGGAELYLSYDFKSLWVRKYVNPAGDEMVVDIYDMGVAADAFGVYSSECEYEEAGIGQGSEYSYGLLRFWKDRYFISILAMGDDRAAKPAVLSLGKSVAAAIEAGGQKPDILKYLPDPGVPQNRLSYFHTPLVLTKHFYLADENILKLDKDTDCLLVEYPVAEQESAFLLIVRYKGKEEAGRAFGNFLDIYMPEGKATREHRTENGRWTLAGQVGPRVIILFDAQDKAWGRETLSKAVNKK